MQAVKDSSDPPRMGGFFEPRHARLYCTRFSEVYQVFEQHALSDVVRPESIIAILDVVGLCHGKQPLRRLQNDTTLQHQTRRAGYYADRPVSLTLASRPITGWS